MSHRKPSSTGQAGQGSAKGMTVQPGEETGCYYLLLSNLQKDTIWRDIKDFLRDGNVQMDHVEIFPGSRNGWVRIYGKQSFDAAVELFKTKPCRGWMTVVDTRNTKHPIWVRNLEVGPLETPAASTATYGTAFAAQIPPLQMSQQSGYNVSMSYSNPYTTSSATAYGASNVSMSYTNPYVTSAAAAYGVSNDYQQPDLEYNKAHPTHYHDAAPAQRTGYEGTELYAASSAAFVDCFANMSVQQPPGGGSGETTARDVSSADFKIQVKLHREGESITQDMVMHFLRACAPLSVEHVLRIDILKGRGLKGRARARAPSSRALLVFDSVHHCSMARQGMFDKEVDNMKLVQDAADDRDPAADQDPADDQEPEPAAAVEQEADDDDEPAEKPIPTGPRDHRTRKEKLRDRRRSADANKKAKLYRQKLAREGHGPSGHGPPGGGSSSGYGYPAPGAPGPWSSSGARPAEDAGGKGKGKEKAAGPLVVDGSTPLQRQQRRDEKPAAPIVVDGTTAVHKQKKHDQKKRH